MILKICRLVLLLCIGFTCFSCTRLIFGIKTVKVESRESVTETAVNWGIDTTSLYFYNRDTIYAELSPRQAVTNYQFLINQNYANIVSQSKCVTAELDLLRGIDSHSLDSLRRIDGNFDNFNVFVKKFIPANSSVTQPDLIHDSDYDFYLLYFWTSYMPRYTKRDLKSIEEIKLDELFSIKVLFINVDLMEEWYVSPESVRDKKIKQKILFTR